MLSSQAHGRVSSGAYATILTKALLLCFLSLVLLSALGCYPKSRERPYGILRLGPMEKFQGAEVFLPELRVLVRHDKLGLSVMSTSCSVDLTPLHIEVSKDSSGGSDAGSRILVSRETGSQYSLDGTVRQGPAVKGLPFYELKIDRGASGAVGDHSTNQSGAKDTLYALIGREVPASWRLALPVPTP